MKRKPILIIAIIAASVIVLGAAGAGLAVRFGWIAVPGAESASADTAVTENGLELTDSVDIENDYSEASDEMSVLTMDEVLADGYVTLGEMFSVNHRERSMTVTEAAHEVPMIDWGARAGVADLVNHEFMLDDIPVLEIYADDGEKKPLLVFLHGITQNKELMTRTLEEFAAAGYHTVSLDAYGQGSRAMERVLVDDWVSMMITIDDISEVIEYYHGVENVDAENFVLGGFSMGGIETWFYMLVGDYTPSALAVLSGMCDISAWQDAKLETLYYAWLRCHHGDVSVVTLRQTDSYTAQKKALIDSMDVTNRPDMFADIPIFFGVGTEDEYFDAERCEAILQTLRDAGNDEITCIVYDGVEHTITDEMRSDALAFLAGLAM